LIIPGTYWNEPPSSIPVVGFCFGLCFTKLFLFLFETGITPGKNLDPFVPMGLNATGVKILL
jgi:hypothetical protein